MDLETLLAPISDTAPTGEDAKYEFSYELMEAEVKKFGSLFGETVDWAVVKAQAEEVLSTHSKDLKACCYLTRALAEDDRLNGVEQGLELVYQALDRFGADLHPRRKRGRDGAIEWLNHQLKLTLPKYEEASWEAVSQCLQVTEKLQGKFDEVYEDSEADLFEIRTQLNGLMQRASAQPAPSEPQPAAEPELAQPDIQAESVAPTPTPKPQVETAPAPDTKSKPKQKEVDIDTNFSTPTASKRTLKKVAETMLHANPAAPLAYRLFRHLTWDDVDGLPDNQEGQTPLILAVSQDQQTEYRDKAQQESDIDTIKRLERTLTDAPFWLTGHYYVFSMLTNLGLDNAATAVKDEVLSFVNEFSGIEKLTFKNSVPFADEATLNWLSSGVAQASGTTTMHNVVVPEDQSLPPVEEVTLENLGDFSADVAQRLEQDRSGRGQFLLYLQLVKAYHSVGLCTLCLPYLEKIWLVREEINLASWEPHLSLQLDVLTQKTLNELYPNKEQLPEKYQDWTTIND